jgi:WD40 repeat protein
MRALFPLLFTTAALGTHHATGSEPEHPAQRAPAAKRVDAAGDPLPEQVLMRLGTLRGRSSGGFWAISPEGKHAVAASDGEPHLWDVATGKRIRKVDALVGWPVVFSPDGKDIVAGAGSRYPHRFYRCSADGERFDVFASERLIGQVHALAYSPDGKLLASGTDRQTLLLWDTKTREVIRQLEGHKERVSALAFSPDGKRLASAGGYFERDTTIRLWDVTTGKLVGELVGHKYAARCLTFSRDGKVLVSGSGEAFGDRNAILWDVASRKLIRRLPLKVPVYTLAISPDDKILAAGGWQQIQLWELSTGKPLRTLQGFAAYVNRVAFTPDGKWLVAACDDTIRTWETATWEQSSPLPGHTTVVHQLAFTPDGKTLLSLGADNRLHTWDPHSGKELHRLLPSVNSGSSTDPRLEQRRPLTLSPDGKTAVTFAYSAKSPVQVWDVARGKLLFDLPDPTTVVGALSFSADGKALVVTGNKGTRVWSVKDRKPIPLLGFQPGAKRENDLGFSVLALPEGRTAVASGFKGLSLLDVASGRLLGTIDLPYRFGCKSVALSPDGRLLATVPRPSQVSIPTPIHVWDVATGRLVRVIDGDELEGRPQVPAIGHGGAVAQVAFAPDGLTLASAGLFDGTVRLWDVLSGKQLARLEGHEGGGVASVAFAPDGRTLASGGFDTTVLLWDVGKFIKPHKAADKELEPLWDALGATDPVKGVPAVVALAGAKDKAVDLLKKHLHPIAKLDEEHVRRLIRDLDARAFATRQKATGELARLGELAEPALRKALQDKPSKEAKMRLESLLADVRPWVRSPEALRQFRGIHVLEQVGSTEALRLLDSLAGGAEDARLTREARAARDRLHQHRATRTDGR